MRVTEWDQSHEQLVQRIDTIDPIRYGQTRNYLDGAVTWLSPYITHGLIDTTTIAERVRQRYSATQSYRLLFELAWREYFHRVWQQHGDDIFTDMKSPDQARENKLPTALVQAHCGINAIDNAIKQLEKTGLMHNHARMWTAAIACNVADTRWRTGAQWLHYHLLDGVLASNTLSWQWIAGTFSNKRYVANQDNINKYSRSKQTGTFLDIPYEHFATMAVPNVLQSRDDASHYLPSVHALPGTPVEQLSQLHGTVALRSI